MSVNVLPIPEFKLSKFEQNIKQQHRAAKRKSCNDDWNTRTFCAYGDGDVDKNTMRTAIRDDFVLD